MHQRQSARAPQQPDASRSTLWHHLFGPGMVNNIGQPLIVRAAIKRKEPEERPTKVAA